MAPPWGVPKVTTPLKVLSQPSVVDILVKLPAYNTALAVCYQESICR